MDKEYAGYKITYNESTEEWEADLGDYGTRNNASLAKLKEAIDRAGQEKKKKPTPQSAFKLGGMRYSDKKVFTLLKVTSKAGSPFAGRDEFWVTDGKDREKTSVPLFAVDEHNKAVLSQLEENAAAKKKLNQKEAELECQLHPFVWVEP
jgi:hypothetical protein